MYQRAFVQVPRWVIFRKFSELSYAGPLFLLARSLGIGMKPCKNVWRLGKRVQEGRGYFEIFLLLSFPQQGCYHGNRKPEFHEQAHARM